jgi:hypothetical protein
MRLFTTATLSTALLFGFANIAMGQSGSGTGGGSFSSNGAPTGTAGMSGGSGTGTGGSATEHKFFRQATKSAQHHYAGHRSRSYTKVRHYTSH